MRRRGWEWRALLLVSIRTNESTSHQSPLKQVTSLSSPVKKKKKRLLPHPASCLWTMVGVFLQDLALGKIPCPLNHCCLWALWSWSWATVRFFNLCEHSVASVVSWLFATVWTVACQAPLLMEFSRKEYRSELPLPSPGHLPNPGIKPGSPTLVGIFFTVWANREALFFNIYCNFKWMKYENGDC